MDARAVEHAPASAEVVLHIYDHDGVQAFASTMINPVVPPSIWRCRPMVLMDWPLWLCRSSRSRGLRYYGGSSVRHQHGQGHVLQ
jgi:hypothetical protein